MGNHCHGIFSRIGGVRLETGLFQAERQTAAKEIIIINDQDSVTHKNLFPGR
jgi:hypothetical protein